MKKFEEPVTLHQDPNTSGSEQYSSWVVFNHNNTAAIVVEARNRADRIALLARVAYMGTDLALDADGVVTGNLDTHETAEEVPQAGYLPSALGKELSYEISPPPVDAEDLQAMIAAFAVCAWEISERSRVHEASMAAIIQK